MSQLSQVNRRRDCVPAPQTVSAQPATSDQDLFGNDAVAQGLSRGKSGEMLVRMSESPDGQGATQGSVEARDGVMFGVGEVRKEGSDRTYRSIAAGAYSGEMGEGLQGRVGGGQTRNGNGLSGTARVVAGDQGARVELGGEASVKRGQNTASLGVTLAGGVVARVEHDDDGAFLVLDGDVSMGIKGGMKMESAGMGGGVSLSGARSGQASVRRRLSGADADAVEMAVVRGDTGPVLAVLGVDGLSTAVDAATQPQAVRGLQQGESVQSTSSQSAGVGVSAALGLAGDVSAQGDVERMVRAEGTGESIRVTLALSAKQATKAGLGVSLFGVSGTGFVDRGGSDRTHLVVVLDTGRPDFDAVYDDLVSASSVQDLRELAQLHPGSTLTGAQSDSWGTGARMSAGGVTGEVRHGVTRSTQTVQEDGRERVTQSLQGGTTLKASFGDVSVQTGQTDGMEHVTSDGELQTVRLQLRDSALELTPAEAADLVAYVQRSRNLDGGVFPQTARLSQVAQERAHRDEFVSELRAAPDLESQVSVMMRHAEKAPNAVIPLFDRASTRDAHHSGDDLGTRTEWPESAASEQLLYTRLMKLMPRLGERPMGLEQLSNTQREVSRVERALDEAEFSDVRARLDMLEQCFRWRQELQAHQRQESQYLSDVEIAEVRTKVAADALDRLTASRGPDLAAIDVAVDVWRAERFTLRQAYRNAGVPQDEWKTASEWVGGELDPDMEQYRSLSLRWSVATVETQRWF